MKLFFYYVILPIVHTLTDIDAFFYFFLKVEYSFIPDNWLSIYFVCVLLILKS